MFRLVPQQADFVDEPRLLGADEALVDLLAFIMIHHVLLQVRFVAKYFPAERARYFVNDMSVSDVIFENAFRGVIFVAGNARVKF